jgi:hypothetical protein
VNGFMIEEDYANTCTLSSNDRLLPAADFQFVAIGIFEKAGVIAAAVAGTKLRTFQIFPADFADQPGEPINFSAALSPKSDSRPVGSMASILAESEERFRFVSACGKEDSVPPARAVANKAERRQQFTVKLLRALQIAYAQVNMIEVSCLFHFCWFSIRTANCL